MKQQNIIYRKNVSALCNYGNIVTIETSSMIRKTVRNGEIGEKLVDNSWADYYGKHNQLNIPLN